MSGPPRFFISIRTMGFRTKSAKAVPRLSFFFDAHFELGAHFHDALVAAGLHEAVKEELSFALFVAGDVAARPVGEGGEGGDTVSGRMCAAHVREDYAAARRGESRCVTDDGGTAAKGDGEESRGIPAGRRTGMESVSSGRDSGHIATLQTCWKPAGWET